MATYSQVITDDVKAPTNLHNSDGGNPAQYNTLKGRGSKLMDASWLRRSFLVDGSNLDEEFLDLRTATSAKFKYTDSSPGGSLVVNPLPQASLLTDPPPVKKYFGHSTYSISNYGNYYSEAFDDNMQVVTMRFGVPAFNSLWRFLNGMYSYEAGKYARTGRGAGIVYNLVRGTLGFVTTLLFWPIKALGLIDKAARYFMNKPSSRFYYLKPTMPMYWDVVQTIVNHLAANTGLIHYNSPAAQSTAVTEDHYHLTDDERLHLHRMLPSIIDEDGTIDVFALSLRGQRAWRRSMNHLIANGMAASDSRATTVINMWSDFFGEAPTHLIAQPKFKTYFESWMSNPASQMGDSSSNMGGLMDMADDVNTFGEGALPEFIRMNLDDASEWISFRVNNGGPVSESFSNDFKSSALGDKINSIGTTVRDVKFDLAQGSLGDNFIANFGEAVFGMINSMGQAAIDAVNLSGLAVIGGAAFADFPQHWDRSTASLPTSSYTINIPLPHNDTVARTIHAFIPLAMLLAAALPRSAGLQSHVEPFLCEIYDRGRAQTRLGMFKSLSIQRGTGNVGWNSKGQWLGLEITFEVMDMGQIVTLPVSEGVGWKDVLGGGVVGAGIGAVGGAAAGPYGAIAGGSLGAMLGATTSLTKGIFDDDNYFNDYMAILSSLGMSSQINRLDKLKRRLTITMANAERLVSKARMSAYMTDNFIGTTLSAVMFYGNANMNSQ